MKSEPFSIEEARARFLELLDDDRWIILDEDEVEARQILRRYGHPTTQYAIVDFIIGLLRSNHPILAIELTNERYRPGIGYVMKKPYGYDLYIKLRLTGSLTNEEVHIMSFHPERPI